MSYQDELNAMSSLVRAWETSHDDLLGDVSIKRLATEERRHAKMLRAIRAKADDGNKRTGVRKRV